MNAPGGDSSGDNPLEHLVAVGFIDQKALGDIERALGALSNLVERGTLSPIALDDVCVIIAKGIADSCAARDPAVLPERS